MSAYYNEIDPKAAAWLRELIKQGHIADGEVDERSIEDVVSTDLAGFTQCHFFAGIGGWSYALRLAGWPDDRPVWTGSCPCQPFSAAGARGGFDDERHLWPPFHHLIEQCRPATVFGEQVASPDGLRWLDLVRGDLEGAGYAVGAANLCAASVGAPHIRQRLYWLGHAIGAGLEGHRSGSTDEDRRSASIRPTATPSESMWMADSGRDGGGCKATATDHFGAQTVRSADQRGGHRGTSRDTTSTHSGWSDADWLGCRDGKRRPVEPGTFALVDGVPSGMVQSSRMGMEIDANKTAEGRVMRLRGYGNAIVPQVAAAFILATEGG